MFAFGDSDEEESEAPKRKASPKPVEFHVAHLQAGEKVWTAGPGRAMVSFGDGRNFRQLPEQEVLLSGKVLFGRRRFAFEVQVLDRKPEAVRKLLKKAQQIEDERFGPRDFDDFGQRDLDKKGTLDWFDAYKAQEYTAKHSIQVKFEDIERVEVAGEEVHLVLRKVQCYVKPDGEMAIVNMECCKDITGGARCIKFKAPDAQEEQASNFRNSARISFSAARRLVSEHSAHMDALFRGQVPVKPLPTPARKRTADEGGGKVKKQRVDPNKLLEDISAPEGSWLQKAVDKFQLKGIRDNGIPDSYWESYIEEREALEPDDDQEEAEEEELEDDPVDGERNASRILGQIRASIAATIKSTALNVDADTFASGVFLVTHEVNDDCGEPRTVNAQARIYAPNATGNYIELWYENHHRVRMSFTERHSHLVASRGGPNMKPAHPYGCKGKKACEKIFDLDYEQSEERKVQAKELENTMWTVMSLVFWIVFYRTVDLYMKHQELRDAAMIQGLGGAQVPMFPA
eukprot:Skav235542  [mRNA]  locus=scaffold3067:204385:208395:+ [translate_table: standard]